MSYQPPAIDWPVNYEAEQAVLGAILLKNATYAQVSGFLEPQHFAEPAHQKIYEACQVIIERGQCASPVSLKAYFEKDEGLIQIGGTAYLAALTNAVVSTINTDEMGRMVLDLYQRREIIQISLESIEAAQNVALDNSATDVAAMTTANLIGLGTANADLVSIGSAVGEVLDDLANPQHGAIPIGMPRLDATMGGGLFPGKFYGLSAKQKAGKTTMLTSISYSLMFNSPAGPVPHLYICMEMGAKEIAQRLVARRLGINSLAFLELGTKDKVKVRTGDGDHDFRWYSRQNITDMVMNAHNDFKQRGLVFQQRPRLSIDALRTTLAQAALSGKFKGVIVDYLQLVTGVKRGQSGADHLDHVAQTLAEFAKEYGMWIITAAQLNREGNVRGGDGLLNACDMTFSLNRVNENEDKIGDEAWMDMTASRYTPYRHVGRAGSPAFKINRHVGPYFDELTEEPTDELPY